MALKLVASLSESHIWQVLAVALITQVSTNVCWVLIHCNVEDTIQFTNKVLKKKSTLSDLTYFYTDPRLIQQASSVQWFHDKQ